MIGKISICAKRAELHIPADRHGRHTHLRRLTECPVSEATPGEHAHETSYGNEKRSKSQLCCLKPLLASRKPHRTTAVDLCSRGLIHPRDEAGRDTYVQAHRRRTALHRRSPRPGQPRPCGPGLSRGPGRRLQHRRGLLLLQQQLRRIAFRLLRQRRQPPGQQLPELRQRPGTDRQEQRSRMAATWTRRTTSPSGSTATTTTVRTPAVRTRCRPTTATRSSTTCTTRTPRTAGGAPSPRPHTAARESGALRSPEGTPVAAPLPLPPPPRTPPPRAPPTVPAPVPVPVRSRAEP